VKPETTRSIAGFHPSQAPCRGAQGGAQSGKTFGTWKLCSKHRVHPMGARRLGEDASTDLTNRREGNQGSSAGARGGCAPRQHGALFCPHLDRRSRASGPRFWGGAPKERGPRHLIETRAVGRPSLEAHQPPACRRGAAKSPSPSIFPSIPTSVSG